MSQAITSLFSKYYKSTKNAHGSDCLFIATEDQNDFRISVDQYIKENNIQNVIRYQLVKQDAISPLNIVKNVYLSLAELASTDSNQILNNLASVHPDRRFAIDFLLDKKLPQLEFPLQDEINHLVTQKYDSFFNIFYELTKSDKLIVICLSDFQYASNEILNFFLEIIKNKQVSSHFLFFCSFVPLGNDKFKDQDDMWSRWSWEMECCGKLIHTNQKNYDLTKSNWTVVSHSIMSEYSINDKLDLAQNLLNMLCFQEAHSLLKLLYEEITSSFSLAVKNRITLLLGRSQMFLNHFEEAMISFDRLSDLGYTHNDETTLCLANLEMAYTNIFRGDYKLAKRYIAYSLKFSQNIISQELLLQVNYCEFLIYDASSSSYSYDKIKALIEKLKFYKKNKELVNVLARTYSQEPSNPDTLTNEMCINYINEAIEIAQRENFKVELAVAYQALGVVNVKRGNIDEAIKFFKLSESIRTKLNIPSEQARIQNGIGYLYCLEENFEDSLAYFVSAMRSVINNNVISEISCSLYNMGWVYFLSGDYDYSLKVLKTLWEILKIKDTKYFPFRNLHDVFILQGFNYLLQGQRVQATKAVRNRQNLDIEISDQGSVLRPLLRAILGLNSGNLSNTWSYINEARLYLNKNMTQLSPLHELLFYCCLIYIYRMTDFDELAYKEMRHAVQVCKKNGYTNYGYKKIRGAWNCKFISCNIEHEMPEAELKQCLYMVKQEQSMTDLWNQVNGMRLCSLLQKLTSSSDDLKYISSETLRLICMHFNVQGGFIYIKDAAEYKVLSTYCQWKNINYSYDAFSDFIIKNQNKKQLIYNKITINQIFFSSVLLLPLKDGQDIIGHMILTTYIGDFVTDANEMETISFITNQFASKVVNLRQRDMLLMISTHDQLTGLKNRQYFQKMVYDLKSFSNNVLVFIDLDNFKNYNDTYGHNVGDKLLIWFSELLVTLESKKCQVCRWGGDEFLVLFNGTTKDKALDSVSKLRDKLRKKEGFVKELEDFLHEKIQLSPNQYLDFSAGLCYSTSDDIDVSGSRMLHLADNLLYDVKRSGKAQIKSIRYF